MLLSKLSKVEQYLLTRKLLTYCIFTYQSTNHLKR